MGTNRLQNYKKTLNCNYIPVNFREIIYRVALELREGGAGGRAMVNPVFGEDGAGGRAMVNYQPAWKRTRPSIGAATMVPMVTPQAAAASRSWSAKWHAMEPTKLQGSSR